MNFPADIYVDASGSIYGASQTDQRYTQTACDARTVGGCPVAYAGRWYGSQMAYRPFRESVAHARAVAAERAN